MIDDVQKLLQPSIITLQRKSLLQLSLTVNYSLCNIQRKATLTTVSFLKEYIMIMDNSKPVWLRFVIIGDKSLVSKDPYHK